MTTWWQADPGAKTGNVVSLPWLNTESIVPLLQQFALANKKTAYWTTVFGSPRSGGMEDLVANIIKIWPDGRLVYKYKPSDGAGAKVCLYVDDENSAMVINCHESDNTIKVSIVAINEKFVDDMIKHVNEQIDTDPPPNGRVYVMISTNHGIEFQSMGKAGIEFEPGNYTQDIIESYNHIVSDIKSELPCGRIVLLNGEPGTGKTFLVRSIFKDCPGATFVLIQSSMISSLAGPELVSALVNLKNDSSGPIVLVVEDADSCLATRGTDNINAISSMLNFGDGILGFMLDIRVVATTNVNIEEIDSALVRPGRLCRRIDIGQLCPIQCWDIYKRLTGKDPDWSGDKKRTLAEVYRLARRDGWVPPVTEKIQIGFNRNKFSPYNGED
jgi:hypothetical protein